MALEPSVLTIADRLRDKGYRTLMSGKWHMGEEANEMPQNHGFDRSFALAASGEIIGKINLTSLIMRMPLGSKMA